MKKIRNIETRNGRIKVILSESTLKVFSGGVKVVTIQGSEWSLERYLGLYLNAWAEPILGGDATHSLKIEIDDLQKAGAVFTIKGDLRKSLGMPPRYWVVVDREPDNPAHSSDGGDYGFWRRFKSFQNGSYSVSYHTTSSFSYCSDCGKFTDHCECEPEVINELPAGATPIW